MLSSECEPWAKTGGLADVVDALARALGVSPAMTSRRRSTSSCRATGASRRRPDASSGRRPARAGSAGAVGHQRGDRHRRRRPTATGCAWSTIRRPSTARASTATRPATTPTTPWRFGLFCRAALEALRADGRPVDVLHLHDWHTGPAAIYRDARYADDPIIGGAAILIDPAQPRLSRLDAANAALGQLGLAAGRRGRRGRRRRHRPAARGHRARGARQHRLARLRRRGADARVRDGPRRRAAGARATGSSASSTGSTRRSGIRPTDADLAAPYSRAIGPARRPAGRTC